MERAIHREPVTQRTLWTYRILGIVTAIVIVAIPFLIPSETAVDPLWQRFTMSGILLGITAGNLFVPFFQRNTYYFLYGYSFLLNIWLISLAFRNNLVLEYSPAPLLAVAATGLIFKHFRLLIIWMAAIFVFTLFLVSLPEQPYFDPWYFVLIQLMIMIGMGILMDRQINERTALRKKGARQKVITDAAFEFSGDGILVVGPDGNFIDVNARFLTMWGLKKEQLQQNQEDRILDAMQKQLESPEEFTAISHESYLFPSKALSQELALLDGRFMLRFSNPLYLEGRHIGRIWFYRDTTKEHRERSREEEKRRLLEAENRALFELATTIEAKEGDRRQKLSQIAKRSLDVLQARSAGIWLRSYSGERFQCILTVGEAEWEPGQLVIPVDLHQELLQTLAGRRVYSLEAEEGEPELDSLRTEHAPMCGAACMYVPLRQNGRLGGFIYIRDHSEHRRWTEEEISFAGSLGDIGGIVLESARRREAEQKLQEKLAVLQSVFEMSGMGILVTALDGLTLDYNADFQEIWQLSEDEAAPGNEQAAIQKMQSLLANPTEGTENLQFFRDHPDSERSDLYRLTDGRIIERNTRPLFVDGRVEGRIWFFGDITARMQSEQALRLSETQNRAIVDAVPDLMIRMDVTGYILNLKVPEAGAYREWLREDSETIETMFPQHFVAEILDMSLLTMDNGEVQEIESQLVLARKLRDLEVRIARSGPGEVLAIIRDVTQRKSAERELIQRNFELDSFVYRASHDLKAPLNSLMGLIDIILKEDIPPEVLKYIRMMDRSVVKLDTFIRNLNEFSRITRLDPAPVVVDMQQLFQEIHESLLYMEEARDVDISLDIKGEGDFFCDRFHLEVILSNLISNAVKYKDLHKPKNWVRVAVRIEAHEVAIDVSDNGIGIPEKYHDRLFELFFRASNQSFGSGLGLYITRNAVGKIGGKINLSSREGEGTSFQLIFPQARVRKEA